jgi:hypothetical protein
MTNKEINSYVELEEFIKQEIKKQLVNQKRVVDIKLDSKWFFKCAKFIQFYLIHSEAEQEAKRQLDDKCKWFSIYINNTKTIFRRYDL